MERYSDRTKCFAVFLAAMYALAGGHLLCASCYFEYATQPAEHSCVHFQASEIHLSLGCCSDHPGTRNYLCSHNDLPAIIAQRNIIESSELLINSFAGFISVVSSVSQPNLVGFCDTITFNHPAISLRLHLLYEVLLI
jgi:hypothetical protein